MKIITEVYDECWEVRFVDRFHLGIVLEHDHAFCTYVDDKGIVRTQKMPDLFFDMIKDKYKIKRPEIVLPKMEEIEALPWD